ncbi:hypothetical protein QAD02_021685 [Eretmocerus hayati]|uniref:Uncharacterized protein n=1 Tax=Eretmocerus hayati TaxID=131215 RepID=A0ACC2PR57_9HYME|nr:hypothetical protein QAD02_021685 [Eretmocerus hayati]
MLTSPACSRYHAEIVLEDSSAPIPPENGDSDPPVPEHAENPQYPFAFPARDLQFDPQCFEVTTDLFEGGSNQNPDIDDSPQIPVDRPPTTLVQNYSSLYLRMETKHNATEPLIQDVVNTTSTSLVQCEQLFNSLLAESTLSQHDKEIVENILGKSFWQIIDCHDLKKDDEIRELIDSEDGNPDDDGIFDICDGNVVKRNILFIIYKNGLKIVIFQDFFEVCDPLASAKTKFKICGVCMMIANLPPHLRSKTNNIKLILLCFDKYINEFGWDEVLDRFLSDMRILETEGVSYASSDGTIQTRRGTIIAGVGDNLGSHCLGGYAKNSSTVQFFSRYCESTLQQLREKGFISGPLRTVQSYNEHAKIAMESGKIYKDLRCNSALNKLQYYHVQNPGLPPCIAHDLFEGIASCDLFLAIQHFITTKGWIKLGLLNYRLKHIPLASTAPVSLPLIQIKAPRTKLVGNASQIRHILMILPVVLADRIRDFEDPVWKMVVKYRDVCDLVCAPALSLDVTTTLAERHELLQSAVVDQYNERAVDHNKITFSNEILLEWVGTMPVNGIPPEFEIKYIARKVTFRGIVYTKDMFICVGKDAFGNFVLCQISAVLIDVTEKYILFVGRTGSIEYNSFVGVYEDALRETDSQSADVLCFHYSSLLSPDPFIQSYIKSKIVYLSKYTPYEKDVQYVHVLHQSLHMYPYIECTSSIFTYEDALVDMLSLCSTDAIHIMNDPHLLKVWTFDRRIKKCIVIRDLDGETLINDAIAQADKKLGIIGKRLVLESDGTEVDDGIILKKFKNETLIVLQNNETWQPPDQPTSIPVEIILFSNQNQPLAPVDMNSHENVRQIEEVNNEEIPQVPNEAAVIQQPQHESGEQSQDGENVQPVDRNNDSGEAVIPVQCALQIRNISSWDDFKIFWEFFNPSLLEKLENGDREPSISTNV